MLNGTLLNPLPLPPGAFQAACDAVVAQGYDQGGILEGYTFAATDQPHAKINAMVFAHPIHRNPAEFASITLLNAPERIQDADLVRTLAESAAPFHLIHRGGTFAFWGSTAVVGNGGPTAIPVNHGISYANLTRALSDYRVDISPQKVVRAKKGLEPFSLPAFRDIFPLQLSLWALDVTLPLLTAHFASAMDDLRRYRTREGAHISEQDVIDLAVQLLGACILWDTGVLGAPDQEPELLVLLHDAGKKFPYFQEQLFIRHEPAAQQAFGSMRRVSFAGFTPEMLTDLYKAAYPREERRNLGRYDTPLYLTRRIWEQIPVEFLPPDQRVVADMTCGWGSFLIAGYERLSGLTDMREEDVRRCVFGNERDAFTSRLAGLGLLVSTSVDSWHVDSGDALQWPWLNEHRPNIIVGNPPFGGNRKAPMEGATTRQDQANAFLSLAIDRLAPNGYLAMLMPMSFVGAEASPQLRTKLLDECDIMELWEFPAKVFTDARVQALVIFARKRDGGPSMTRLPLRVATVQPSTIPLFRETEVFTTAQTADQESFRNGGFGSARSTNRNIFDYSIILPSDRWAAIRGGCVSLSHRADIAQGAITGSVARRRRPYHNTSRDVLHLESASKTILGNFNLRYDRAQTRQYPDDFEWPREDQIDLLLGQKVIIASVPNPTWGKRVNLAIDRSGYCVSNGFWMLGVPEAGGARHMSLEVIAAVVGWYVGNAWVVEHLKSPNIRRYSLDSLPFPRELSQEVCQQLTTAVRAMEVAAEDGQEEPEVARELWDRILRAAYGLDDWTYERLKAVYYWDSVGRATLDPEPDTSAADWKIGGMIHGVDARARTVTLWVDGFDHLKTVPIISSMPGWLLRPDTSFQTSVPRRCIHEQSLEGVVWGQFFPQPYSYMSDEELLDNLADILETSGELSGSTTRQP